MVGRGRRLAVAAAIAAAALAGEPAARAGKAPARAEVDEAAVRLVRAMAGAWSRVRDYMGILDKKELVGSDLRHDQLLIKFRLPSDVYIKYLTSRVKREVIYRGRSWNDGKIKIAKVTALRITVDLSPYDRRLLATEHHPLTHVGLGFLVRQVVRFLDGALARGEARVRSLGASDVAGARCRKVRFEVPADAGEWTTAEVGDTWWKLAKRTGMDRYVLIHANPGALLLPGRRLFIPRYYGSSAELCIGDGGLPLDVVVRDAAGRLYEHYRYEKLAVNPGLTDADFDPDNERYEF